jgi:predicted Zn-dependent peptidase
LERIKAYVRGGFLLGLEGTQQVASWLGSQECLYNQVRDVDEIITHVNAVSASDIQRVAQACFAPEWRRLAIIGPHNTQGVQVFEKLLSGV